MVKDFKLHNYRGSIIAAFLLFFFAQPYFFWSNVFQNNYVQFLVGIIMAILFLRNKEFDRITKMLATYFVVLLMIITLIQGRNIFYLLSILPFAAIPFAGKKFTKSTYDNFLNIYCFITFFSLIVWTLALIGAAPQLGIISPLNQLKEVSYVHYPLLVLVQGSYRFCGVFDEAGVIGTLSGIFLCIQGFKFKDKRSLVLLVSGLCSMSLFFYIMIGAYGVFYYITQKKSVWKAIIMLTAIYCILYVVKYIPILNEIIGSRLEWNAEEMRFAGDNRTNNAIVDYLTSIIGTNEFWFGVDNKNEFWKSVAGECNIYITILMNGALFCLLYLGFMIVYGMHFKKTWTAFILFLFVFLTCIYQRPFLFSAYFIFLWTYMARSEVMECIKFERKIYE